MWAAEAKGRSEWGQVEATASAWVGTREARKLNPYRRPKRRQRRGPATEQESAMGWAVLDRFFGQRHRN